MDILNKFKIMDILNKFRITDINGIKLYVKFFLLLLILLVMFSFNATNMDKDKIGIFVGFITLALINKFYKFIDWKILIVLFIIYYVMNTYLISALLSLLAATSILLLIMLVILNGTLYFTPTGRAINVGLDVVA